MVAHWDEIEVVSSNINSIQTMFASAPNVGDKYKVAVELDTKGLNDRGVGVELVAMRTSLHNNDKLYDVVPLNLKKAEGSHLLFETNYQLNYAGGMKFALRRYPKNELLPHRMDFAYVRWIG